MPVLNRRPKRRPSNRLRGPELLEPRRLLTVAGFETELAALPAELKSGPLAKLSDELQVASAQFAPLGADTIDLDIQLAADSFLPIYGGLLAVDVVAAVDVETALNDLIGVGFSDPVSFGTTISGLIAPGALDELAALDSVQFARTGSLVIPNVGATTSQADVAMQSDDARSLFGADGTGVTIGVLSDSYDALNGAATDIASGDLPAGIDVLQDISPATDEGRAMLQLIHDVAPGADLAFTTAFLGQASFAQGIVDLATTAGADIIVDDVFYFAEPMLQDGIIAQAVDQVVALGVPYFSSAGNSARASYESAFVDSGTSITVGGQPAGMAHDFDPGAGVDFLQEITIPFGTSVTFSFQWDSPFFSVSPGSGGSPNDIDIYLVNDAGSQVLAQSVDSNVGGDPVELLSFTNFDLLGGSTFNLLITNFSGPDPGLMKYVYFDGGGTVTVDEFDTSSGTVFGHANAAGAEAVGAAFYQDTPEFGAPVPLLEPFSSAGGTPILFDTAGLPVFEQRLKPEIVAPDGTNTTFFGFDIEPDGFPNFFGTSAAAPHAAAVAALLLEFDSALTPSQVYGALETTAINIGPAGFDDDSGFGLIDAVAALGSVGAVSDAPEVASVAVSGTDWDPAFAGGAAIPAGSEQSTPLPWFNVDRIQITFDEDVNVTQSDLSLSGVAVPSYSFLPAGSGGFSYNATTFTATWVLTAAIGIDELTLVLDDAVTSAFGVALDGEWIDSTSTFPSGDGTPDGDFVFGFNVLPGDASGDGTIDAGDYSQWADDFGDPPPLGQPSRSDFDANGAVNAGEYSFWADAFGDSLPPAGPAAANPSGAGTSGVAGTANTNTALVAAPQIVRSFEPNNARDSAGTPTRREAAIDVILEDRIARRETDSDSAFRRTRVSFAFDSAATQSQPEQLDTRLLERSAASRERSSTDAAANQRALDSVDRAFEELSNVGKLSEIPTRLDALSLSVELRAVDAAVFDNGLEDLLVRLGLI